ncbi:MAG: hypothetical protein L6Q54_07250 [Leptospiraceae bacterium]|nr:hypothetical protein [Leptospiraceae bacterium]MCK6381032.1 hypothetical protein [Leptospiraceae bacterium]NUM41428.1 hypothetical protein [Leptospiraceae bacterium]
MIEDKNYIALAILCSEIQENVFEKECSLGMKKSEEEISDIVNGLKDLPFSKVHVEQNKRKLIEVLFKKNTHLQIKYSQIWKESVYEN